MSTPRISCGLETSHVHDIAASLQESARSGYDFLSVPLVHPRFHREFIEGKAKDRDGAFTRADILLPSSDWNSLIVGNLTPRSCLLCESEVDSVRVNHEAIIQQELTYATHLGLPAILVSLTSSRCVNLARLLHNKVTAGVCYQVWIRVSMQAPFDACRTYRSDIPETDNLFATDTWAWWNKFHSVANLDKKIGLALEVTEDLPDQDVLDRWLGEPIRAAILPTNIFLTNKSGFPVLSKAHQNFVRNLFRIHVQFIITGQIQHSHLKLYQQYLDHLFKMNFESDAVVNFARGYEDFLQCPLQPLMDNLESQTYEVFEKDPVKYAEYERAMARALCDLVPEDRIGQEEVVVMVLGAGRGPLVRRALDASRTSRRKIRIYAVEKNPNAVVTLQAQKDENWGDLVKVVSCDMREWKAPEKADIIVSELLGSFGDNELSPECLDGAQVFLKDDGICIPSSYTSFLCPVQSCKLYNEIRNSREKDKHVLAHFETPYVVYLQNKTELAPPQSLFTFEHPNKSSVIDNRRYQSLQFHITMDSVVHGLAGYFETVLYKDVVLSIKPDTHSPGMFSWFPILFPLKAPIPVTAGDIFEVHFWRCANTRKVWYEWAVTSPMASSVHNPNGRAYTIGL